MKRSCKHLPVVYLTAVLSALTISAAVHAATMDVLLRGHDLRLQYESGEVILVTFTSNGQYKTSTGSSGAWTLDAIPRGLGEDVW
ncbi:MAG: hypothetical protein ACE5I1_24750, partial [bacterium]